MLAHAAPVENGDDSLQSGPTTNFIIDQGDYTQHLSLDNATSATTSPSSSKLETLAYYISDYSSSASSSRKATAALEVVPTVGDDDTFDRITSSGFSYEFETSTSAEALDELVRLPVGVTIVIVLASACVVLGLVYGYIYITQIQIQTTRAPSAANNKPSRKHSSVGGSGGDGRGAGGSSDHQAEGHDDGTGGDGTTYGNTHMFLFRKYRHAPTIT